MTVPQARRKMIETYRETGSLRATVRIWQTTRCTVRKWVRRFEAACASFLAWGKEVRGAGRARE